MTRAAIVLLMLASLVLAGCSDGGGGDGAAPVDDVADNAPTGAGGADAATPDTPDSEPVPDAPPSASLTVDVVEGEAPLDVTFTLDGADADPNATLSWSLDVNGDGEAEATGGVLPSTFTFTYVGPGVFEAEVTVTDGRFDAYAQVTVSVRAPPAPEPVQVAEASWEAGVTGCLGAYPMFPAGAPGDGVLHGVVSVAEGTVGLPFVLEVTASSGLFVGYEFHGADGGLVASDFITGAEGAWESTVPDGAAFALVYNCGAGSGVATYTVMPAE